MLRRILTARRGDSPPYRSQTRLRRSLVQVMKEVALSPATRPATTAERVHAALAQWTASISPASLHLAWGDWAAHLAASPGKRLELLHLGLRQLQELANYVGHSATPGACPDDAPCVTAHPGDRRFREPEWRPATCCGRAWSASI